MITNSGGDTYTLTGVTLSAGQTWKIADRDYTNGNNFGGNVEVSESGTAYTLTDNGGNCSVKYDFTGDITFVKSTKKVTFTGTFATPNPAPTVSFSPNGGNIDGKTASVAVTVGNADSWTYSINGGAAQTGVSPITIGSTSATGDQSITLSVTAVGNGGTTTESKTFTLKYTPLYVVGEGSAFGSWGGNGNGILMSSTDGDTYTLTINNVKKGQLFKIWSGNWDNSYGPSSETEITAGAEYSVIKGTSSKNFKFDAEYPTVAITFVASTKKLSFTGTAVTCTSIKVNGGGYTNREILGSANAIRVPTSGVLNGTETFIFTASFSDGTSKTFVPQGDGATSNGVKDLKVGSVASKLFASNICSAQIYAKYEGGTVKVNVSDIDKEKVIESDYGVEDYDGGKVVYVTTQRGTKYYKVNGLTSPAEDGEYTSFTEVDTQAEAKFTVPEGFTTALTLNGLVPAKLTVTDPNPPITEIRLIRRGDTKDMGSFKKQPDGTFLWEGTVEAYNKNANNNPNWNGQFYLTTKVKNSSTTTYWYTNAEYADNTWWLDPGTDNYAPLTNGGTSSAPTKFIGFTTGGKIYVTVTLKADDHSALDQIWYSDKEPMQLTTYPYDARINDNDWDAVKWPVVYLTADYLNANRLVPDWEMRPDGTGKYVIEGATLRGNGSGAAIGSRKLTVVVVNDKECTNVQTYDYTPAASLLESGERQMGQTFTVTFDPTATNKITVEKTQPLPTFISMVGYKFQQPDNEATPNAGKYGSLAGHTSTGWQESWILYDEEGQPIRDIYGNYIYSTQWPPVNPVYFRATEGGFEDKDFSSDNLILLRDKRTNDGKPMTQAQWKEYLTTDDYKNHLFVNDCNSSEANIKYARYTVSNSWIWGASKIWTGWGSYVDPNNGGEPEWDLHMNWGRDGASTANDGGETISANTTYNMTENKGNFLFAQPTYFKTVEFYLPVTVDGDGNITGIDGANKSKAKFYTTLNVGDAKIEAAATKIGGASQPNAGKYKATIDMTKCPTGFRVKSWTITRYDARTSDMTSTNPEDWNAISSLNGVDDYVVASWKDSDGGNATGTKLFDISTETATWVNGNLVLDNGRYFYGLHVEFSNEDGSSIQVADAMSNPFTIANYDYGTKVWALQLVDLKEDIPAGKKAYPYRGKSLTYRAKDNTGEYYIVDREANTAEVLPQATAEAIIAELRADRSLFTWTSDYYVGAFRGANYASDMAQEVKDGNLTSYQQIPDIYIQLTTKNGDNYVKPSGSSWTAVPVNKATRTSNGRLYGRVIRRNGSLAETHFAATIGYSFQRTGETGSTTVAPGERVSYYTLTPELPTAWAYSGDDIRLNYRYKHTQPSQDLTQDTERFPVDYIGLYVESSVDDKPEQLVLINKKDLDPRNFDCVINFYRPNISAEIFQYYDIEYTLEFESSDPNKSLSQFNGVYYDALKAAGELGSSDAYQVTIRQTSPRQAIYPTLRVVKTEYIHNGDGNSSYEDLVGTYGKANPAYDVEIKCVYTANKKDAELTGVALRSVVNPSDPTKLDWHYQAHNEFSDPGDDIVSDGLYPWDMPAATDINKNDQNQYSIELTPAFYHVELTLGEEFGSYPILMHHPKNHDNWWNDGNGTPNDPYYMTHLATFTKKEEGGKRVVPNFHIAPIYVFNRTVNPEIDGNGISEITALVRKNAPAAAPQRAPRRAAAEVKYVELPKGAKVPYVEDEALEAVKGGAAYAPGESIHGTTGVEDVLYDADAQAEYFTVTGIRVERPRQGEVYIVRRGATVAKEVYLK